MQLPPGIAYSNGRLEADALDVDTKFAGRIAKLFVDEGDIVTAGQIGRHLGLTGAHANRVLRWLSREDIAQVKGYVVIIRDLPRLRRLSRGEEEIEMRPRAEGDPRSHPGTRPIASGARLTGSRTVQFGDDGWVGRRY
jgi:hypothetical protein